MEDVKGKIIVVTNRNLNQNQTDHKLFGDDLNPKGAEAVEYGFS